MEVIIAVWLVLFFGGIVLGLLGHIAGADWP